MFGSVFGRLSPVKRSEVYAAELVCLITGDAGILELATANSLARSPGLTRHWLIFRRADTEICLSNAFVVTAFQATCDLS